MLPLAFAKVRFNCLNWRNRLWKIETNLEQAFQVCSAVDFVLLFIGLFIPA